MRILFFNWEFPPRGSGIGRYIYHMSQALREVGCFTVIVTSYGEEGPSETQLENGVIYRCYQVEDIGKLSLAQYVLDKAHKHKIDLIEGADHLGEAAALLSCKNRPPVVIKAHYNDVLEISRYAHMHYFWQRPLINFACLRNYKKMKREKISLSKADLLIAPSKRILQEMKIQGLQLSERQSVVPNPISPLPYWSNVEALHPTILLVGRIDVGKGIGYLSRLVKMLLPQFPELSLEIAGKDSYARFLGSTQSWLTKELGICRDAVRFLGELDEISLDRAYSRAWVVIVPSKWDTFPTVVLEAMIRGKAIVSSPNGGMPEMLADTSCVVADPDSPGFHESIREFLSNRLLRQNAGLSSQLRARTIYSPTRVADLHLQTLREHL